MAWLVTWDDEYVGRLVLARCETEDEAKAIETQLTPTDSERWLVDLDIEEEEIVGHGPSAKWSVEMVGSGEVIAVPKPPVGEEVISGMSWEIYAPSRAEAKQRYVDELGLQPKIDALKMWQAAKPA